jgi:hypothetical protein
MREGVGVRSSIVAFGHLDGPADDAPYRAEMRMAVSRSGCAFAIASGGCAELGAEHAECSCHLAAREGVRFINLNIVNKPDRFAHNG